jgi:hypothetical protein
MSSLWNVTAVNGDHGAANGAAPVDWASLKLEIVAKLDVAAEYRALGVRFTKSTPTAKGWLECYAVDRTDDVPSAAVNVGTGVYHDSGGDKKTCGFLDFAARHGNFGSWIDCVKHYADKAGMPLGKVARSKGGRIREATYLYRDADGAVRYAVFRYRQPNGKKTFTQHPPDGRGGWRFGDNCMEGVEPLPYRLPELLAADRSEPVWVVEGEKDAEALARLGLVATTNHQGAGSTDVTWPRFASLFAGRTCHVVPDNDPAGRDHARKVCLYLMEAGATARVVNLPDLPAKGDVSDWLDLGHDAADLRRLAAEAPVFGAAEPKAEAPPADADASLPPDAEVVTVCLRDVERAEVEWLMPDRVPLGKVTLFAGEAKLGKSFVTLDIAARVSQGDLLPGSDDECIPRGSVVLLSAEDDIADTIKPRLEAAGADFDRIHALTTLRLPNGKLARFNLSYLAHLERAIVRFADTKLVIIDPITSYIGARVDDHKASQLRDMIDPIKELAGRRKVAIVIVTHLNKAAGTKALNRVTGSGAYTALARSNWLFVKDADDPHRRLFLSAGTNLVEDPAGLAYRIDRETRRVVWEPSPVLMDADEALRREVESHQTAKKADDDGKLALATVWLLDRLKGGVEVPSDQLIKEAEAAGFSSRTLFRAKKDSGVKARKVGFQGAWSWYIAPPADGVEEPDVVPFGDPPF